MSRSPSQAIRVIRCITVAEGPTLARSSSAPFVRFGFQLEVAEHRAMKHGDINNAASTVRLVLREACGVLKTLCLKHDDINNAA